MKTVRLSTEALQAVTLFCHLSTLARQDLARPLASPRPRDARGNDLALGLTDLDTSLSFFARLLGDLHDVDDNAALLQELRGMAPQRVPRSRDRHEQRRRIARDWNCQRALIWMAAGQGCLRRVLQEGSSPTATVAIVCISNLTSLLECVLLLSEFDGQGLREYVTHQIGSYDGDDVLDIFGVAVAS